MHYIKKNYFVGFIRKVYAIVTLQLMVTMVFVVLFTFVPPIRYFANEHSWIMIIAAVTSFVFMFALTCFESLRRTYPWNVVLLTFFVSASCMAGCSITFHSGDTVALAIGITTLVVFALTLFAFQTKIDFTVCNGVLFVAIIILMVFGIMCIFIMNRVRHIILHLVYASLGAFLFCLYIVMDTQMIIGGSHKYAISPEEYVFAALTLYMDIINLFMYILMIARLSK
ncbi:hypothetical protein HELRODRAFT_64141 [Helobdella robusta]|uniref:Uncharacterized protein n=1 Tax=Helobdella robusta TaxID=6412 RepID=T1FXQ2_HELRO|nr:hypothetical protein HELRODRAFT_64141 [Helobdella robusta]ESO06711.1 hypothetical protein HELRODRAFT_64141 [Helobdella robusta]